jgi:hypothetical protein
VQFNPFLASDGAMVPKIIYPFAPLTTDLYAIYPKHRTLELATVRIAQLGD